MYNRANDENKKWLLDTLVPNFTMPRDTKGVPKVFANERTMKDTVNLIVPSSATVSHNLCRTKSASC